MIDVRSIAAEAASQFGLSLRDDPTAWSEMPAFLAGLGLADTDPDDIVDTCRAEAAACAVSAVNRALGSVSEKIATAMDVAIHEDGPLADLDAVWAQFVTGLSVDTAPVAAAKDWQGRVDALREAIRRAAPSVTATAPMPHVRDVLAYVNSDPRFDGMGKLKKGIAAIREPGDDAEDFVPPAFLTKNLPEEPVAPASPAVDWSDEEPAADPWADDEPAPAKAPRKRASKAAAAAPSRVPGFPAMLLAAGMTKADAARLLGFSESYVNVIFAGKRPWPGLHAGQVKALREEIALRQAALAEAVAVLDSGKLLTPAEA